MWIIYALICAFFLATSDALAKRILETEDERWVAWIRIALAVPFLLPFLFFTSVPALDRTFWIATFAALPLEILAILLYIRAIKVSPLSLTIPFLAFTPLFLVAVAYLVLGERPGTRQLVGILCIVAGGYLLNVRATKEGVLGPIRAVTREKGSLLMLLVALIFSITSTLGKLAINHSGPVFFGAIYFTLVTVAFSPFVLAGKDRPRPRWRWGLLGVGLSYGMMALFHYLALSMTQVAYMISVKRTSIIFSVLYGWLIFREKDIGERLLGSAVMLVGVVLVTV